MVRQLLPLLERAADGRIIIVTSGYYKQATELLTRKEVMGESMWDYTAQKAYSNSKMANCLFTKELSWRLQQRDSPVQAYAIRPGFVRGTELGRQTNWLLRTIASPLIWAVSCDLDQGISGIVHCATESQDVLAPGGLYYGKTLETYVDTVNKENQEKLWRQCERVESLVAKRSHGKMPERQFDWPSIEHPEKDVPV
ncbi:unnamed protein product, partial [Mesorhabditis spiculigera]